MSLSFLLGTFTLPWWGYVLVALILTQTTIVSVTVYLHRHQTHRALEMSPLLSHFFRFWLWLTTGIITKEWVAIHRKHHDTVETDEDPHSPRQYGINKVLWDGYDLYRTEAEHKETLVKYGQGTPDDWVERYVYSKMHVVGVASLLIIHFLLLGAAGVAIWAMQMMWIPFFAAGVINGLGHWWGYRNFECRDNSTNIVPWGLFIGGEELHNNHHAFANSARFSSRWWEVDIGWGFLCLFRALGLVKINKIAPKYAATADHPDGEQQHKLNLDTLRAVLANRQLVMASYCRNVVRRVCSEELSSGPDSTRANLLSYASRFAMYHREILGSRVKGILDMARDDPSLGIIYQQKAKLQKLWELRAGTVADMENVLQYLSDWCHEAEKSEVAALKDFALTLRGYSAA